MFKTAFNFLKNNRIVKIVASILVIVLFLSLCITIDTLRKKNQRLKIQNEKNQKELELYDSIYKKTNETNKKIDEHSDDYNYLIDMFNSSLMPIKDSPFSTSTTSGKTTPR